MKTITKFIGVNNLKNSRKRLIGVLLAAVLSTTLLTQPLVVHAAIHVQVDPGLKVYDLTTTNSDRKDYRYGPSIMI